MIQLPEFLLQNRVVKDNGCWEWIGGMTGKYGSQRYQGRPQRVHRIVAHIVHGLFLGGGTLQALHKCDNPICFNPDHLYIGRNKDNMKDKADSNKFKLEKCRFGHPIDGRWEKNRYCKTCRAKFMRSWRKKKRMAELV